MRAYKQKKPLKYTEKQLLAAIDAVKLQKMKVTLAARKFNIPATTLYDHTKGRLCKIGAGAPTVLTPGEEKEIVVTLQVLQEIGFGLTKELAGGCNSGLFEGPAYPSQSFLLWTPWDRLVEWLPQTVEEVTEYPPASAPFYSSCSFGYSWSYGRLVRES